MKFSICHTVFSTPGKLPPLRNELIMLSRESVATVVLQVDTAPAAGLEDDAYPGIVIRNLRIRLRGLSENQTNGWKILRYLEYTLRAFLVLLYQRADLIVAHDLSALLPAWCAAKLTGRKIVYNAHEIYGETNGITAPMQKIWRWLDRRLCPRIDRLVVPEENRARIYHEEYGAAQVPFLLPNYPLYKEAVPSRLLHESLNNQGLRPDFIVLYQGLFDEGRCLHSIIEAMPDVPEPVCLVLMGRGFDDYSVRLHRLRAELRLEQRVVFHPFVPYEQLHAYSCSADAGILLYRNDCRNNYYCAPNKLYEYGQAGLPVIASNFPGLRTLVEGNELGICVDPLAPKDIASAMKTLYADSNAAVRRDRILALAREKFHWEQEFPRLKSLYEELEKRSK